MRTSIIILTLLLFLVSFAEAQTPEIIKLADLQRIMNSRSDTTYVVNFWATWCVPCVKEFPSFQKVAKEHKNEKVKFVMISLNFKSDFEKSLVPFVQKHPINGEVYLLDEPDYNSWINKINPAWQGDIPATFIFNNARRIRGFFPTDFTIDKLEQTFNSYAYPDSTFMAKQSTER